MEKTNVIVGSPNVSGNIGSCEIKSTNFQKTLFTKQTTAVNSCTGEIFSQSVYFDSNWLFGLPILYLLVGFVCFIFKALLKDL